MQIEIERQRVEIFRRRVDALVEVFGQNAVVNAESKVDVAYFKTYVRRIYFELQRKVVLPQERNVAFVGVEFDKLVWGNLLARQHTHQSRDERFGKVDFDTRVADAEIGHDAAEHVADDVHDSAVRAR